MIIYKNIGIDSAEGDSSRSVINKPMQWIVALTATILGIAGLAFLLWEKAPIESGSFKLGDLTNLLTILIAVFSLYVAVATYQQSIKDSEEQQKSLESSRAQLEAVVETLEQQHQTLSRNLEASKDLLGIQREQQAVLADSLKTSRALLALQKEERERVHELANRKPQVHVVLGSEEISDPEATFEVNVDKNNNAVIPLMVKNIGTANLLHPGIYAIASRKDVKLRLDGSSFRDAPNTHRSELGGLRVKDMLTFKSSGSIYEASIHLGNLVSDEPFDIHFSMDGENLEQSFRLILHIKIKREVAS